MALLGDFDEGYTRTGGGWLTGFANKLSFIPLVGGVISYPFSLLDTAIESISWLLQGKVLSAATAATTGFVSSSVNLVAGATWWAEGISGVATGRSVGTHARMITEQAIGAVTGVLGIKPTVLRSYPAGIGSIGGDYAPSGPGQFASAEAARRGQDPQAYYASKMNGDMAQHVAELDSARARPNYQGMNG